MQLSETQTKLAGAFIVALVLVVAYVLWSRTSVPEPVVGPNQTLQNPFGQTGPGGLGGAGGPGGPTPGQAGMPATPRPGTSLPGLGAGPSANAPIPGNPNFRGNTGTTR